MPTCISCKKEKDSSEFSLKKKAQTPNKTCTPCVSTVKARYAEKKAALQKYQRERYHEPAHKKALLAYQRLWFEKNPGYITSYNRERCKSDALYARRKKASEELGRHLRRKNPDHFDSAIGCTSGSLRAHIESLFQDGMAWDNYGRGGWHLDHIFPLSAAMERGVEAFEKALNWRNVQPLWEAENMAKFATLPEQWPTVEAFMAAW